MSTVANLASNPLAERLLALMDQKHHWAYPALTRPGLTRAQLLQHFRHEYLVYVRDFPALIARVLGQVPPVPEVRAALAENIYEEQTGGLSGTAPHPELFLRMMTGLGYSREAIAGSLGTLAEDDAWIHPAARAYRDFLREHSAKGPWQAAVALMTVFVEGSVNERAELAGTFVRPKGEAAVAKHALVVHRGDAWRMVLGHSGDDAVARSVVDTCMTALSLWHRYRDGVAQRMGLARDDERAA